MMEVRRAGASKWELPALSAVMAGGRTPSNRAMILRLAVTGLATAPTRYSDLRPGWRMVGEYWAEHRGRLQQTSRKALRPRRSSRINKERRRCGQGRLAQPFWPWRCFRRDRPLAKPRGIPLRRHPLTPRLPAYPGSPMVIRIFKDSGTTKAAIRSPWRTCEAPATWPLR